MSKAQEALNNIASYSATHNRVLDESIREIAKELEKPKCIRFEFILNVGLNEYYNNCKKLDEYLSNGYTVVSATPVLGGKSCYTFTHSIIYILEKKVLKDD